MGPLLNAINTTDGVKVNGVLVSPCVPQCEGCDRTREFDNLNFCSTYPSPTRKWSSGRCNFATHMKAQGTTQAKVNPLKASKRAAKGR